MNKEIFTHIEVWIVATIALLLGLVVGLNFSNNSSHTVVESSDQVSQENIQEKSTEPVTTKLEGSGQQSTREVDLRAGKATVRSVNRGGDTNFTVYLVDEAGKEGPLLANELGGDSDTSKSINIAESGKYTFNINGNGSWTIEITQ